MKVRKNKFRYKQFKNSYFRINRHSSFLRPGVVSVRFKKTGNNIFIIVNRLKPVVKKKVYKNISHQRLNERLSLASTVHSQVTSGMLPGIKTKNSTARVTKYSAEQLALHTANSIVEFFDSSRYNNKFKSYYFFRNLLFSGYMLNILNLLTNKHQVYQYRKFNKKRSVPSLEFLKNLVMQPVRRSLLQLKKFAKSLIKHRNRVFLKPRFKTRAVLKKNVMYSNKLMNLYKRRRLQNIDFNNFLRNKYYKQTKIKDYSTLPSIARKINKSYKVSKVYPLIVKIQSRLSSSRTILMEYTKSRRERNFWRLFVRATRLKFTYPLIKGRRTFTSREPNLPKPIEGELNYFKRLSQPVLFKMQYMVIKSHNGLRKRKARRV